MKFTKKMLLIFLALGVSLLTARCGGGGGGGGGTTASTPAVGASLISIMLAPGSSTVGVGGVTHFTVTGAYSDNSAKDLTGNADWVSSAGGVASVSNEAGSKGMATAKTVGRTEITASFEGFSSTAQLTVTVGDATANVMPVTVNGSLCSPATSANYINKACVSVTICNPGTSTCQTVSDILLDTGSYGLRIFKQALPNLTLPAIASGSGSLAGCVQFADGTSLWGPIRLAGVQLGNEQAVQIPIQIVDASFGTRPGGCGNADQTPESAGLTGILGVGVFNEDCGPGCASSAANGIYYSCLGSSCSGASVPIANQVQNPVSHLPTDNNGVTVQMSSVPLGGALSSTGSLVLGIGTQANNSAAPAQVFTTNSNGEFTTILAGNSKVSFLDTGSNGIFFPSNDPLLPVCPSSASDWYCPAGTKSMSATIVGALGAPSAPASFNVTNFVTLMNSSNDVFSDLAGPTSFGVDWGLPFFMGKTVYVGVEGKTGLGTIGPYVAY